MKEVKRVFLYGKKTKGDIAKLDRISAVSEDEKHKFDFIIEQNTYDESVANMKAAFEKFCVDECGFDNSEYCDVWLLDDVPLKGLDFENDISWWLGSVDWGCYDCIEFEFKNKIFHLKNSLSFEEFKTANGYDESKEPFETKRIYEIFKREIDKREFDKDELSRIVQFIKADNYSKLFAAISKNYPMRLQLQNAFCALYHSDRAEYEKQIANVCRVVKNKITVMLGRIAEIFSELPETYHEEYDYDDWVAYEKDEANDDQPIYLRKYFDMIPDSELQDLLFVVAAQKIIKGKSRKEVNMGGSKIGELRRRVDDLAYETGDYWGIRHFDEDGEFDEIIEQNPEMKEELEILYDKYYREGVLTRMRSEGDDIGRNFNRRAYQSTYYNYLKNNPDLKDDIIFEFNSAIYYMTSYKMFDRWIKSLVE